MPAETAPLPLPQRKNTPNFQRVATRQRTPKVRASNLRILYQ
ncbi:MAG: hypothetical protein GQF41_2473 [Candidatus Rifleibacterium amylolyticum]|nr:MAG: hypothetical protein GQF41_2473 [Candidatus Rifleibacterium amylolyticum]